MFPPDAKHFIRPPGHLRAGSLPEMVICFPETDAGLDWTGLLSRSHYEQRRPLRMKYTSVQRWDALWAVGEGCPRCCAPGTDRCSPAQRSPAYLGQGGTAVCSGWEALVPLLWELRWDFVNVQFGATASCRRGGLGSGRYNG